MDRSDEEQKRLSRLVGALADVPGGNVRWISADGLVVDRGADRPWWLVVGGDDEGRATLDRLLARWAPPTAEVLLVGGRADPVGVPSVHVGARGGATPLGATELGAWVALQLEPAPRAPAAPLPGQGPRPGRVRQWLDGRQPFFTPLFIALCVVMYAIQLLLDVENQPERFLALGLLPGHGGLLMPWSMLTYAWLHGSPLHLMMNMLMLASTGALLEPLLGRGRFVVLYVLSAIGGGLFIALFTNAGAVGASGAIWGLMTATVVIAWRGYGILSHSVRRAILPGLTRNLMINALISLLPGISLAGHLGGGLVGAALVATGVVTAGLVPRVGQRPGMPRWLAALAIVCLVLIVVAELLAVTVGSALAYFVAALAG